MTGKKALLITALFASAIFIVISITAKVPTYRFNFVFLIPLAFIPYFFRRPLHLHAMHYVMFIIAILLHDIGGYGFYRASPLPFSYDILVHYYFAIPVTLIMYRALAHNMEFIARWKIGITTLLFMMGLGALHEIMEYMSYLLLGEERRMLKPSTSYFFDTQHDLTNNLLGTLTALLLLLMVRFVNRPPSGFSER